MTTSIIILLLALCWALRCWWWWRDTAIMWDIECLRRSEQADAIQYGLRLAMKNAPLREREMRRRMLARAIELRWERDVARKILARSQHSSFWQHKALDREYKAKLAAIEEARLWKGLHDDLAYSVQEPSSFNEWEARDGR